MRTKYIKFIVYSGVLLSMGIVNFAYSESNLFEKNLYFGLNGDSDVVRLQEFLTKEGVYNGPQNGNFYSLTKEAVIKYQKNNNITPSVGYVGPITRGAINKKIGGAMALPYMDKSIQIQALQSQINMLLAQLATLQSLQQVATTTNIIPVSSPDIVASSTTPIVATSTTEVIATTTTSLPSSFDSTLKIKSNWADYTLTRFSAVILGEFSFSADEKIAITKLKFTNTGTLSDDSIHDLQLLDSQTNEILSIASLENGVATFSMTPDSNKINKGLVVSGKTYLLLADTISASTYGVRYTVEYDIKSESDISAFDYDDLSRTAKLKEVTFPVVGSYIKTY